MNLRWLLFAACSVSLPALAQGANPALDVSGCAGLDAAELAQLLSVELSTVHAEGDVSALDVVCREGRVEVHAVRAGARVHAFTLQGVESDALARLLALRISEWMSTEPEPLPSAPPPAPPAPEVDEPRALDMRGHRVALTAEATRTADPALWLGGVAASLDLALARHLWARVDVGARAGRAETALAEVAMRDLHAFVGLVSGVDTAHADLRAGLGLRCAYAFLTAEHVADGHRGRSLAAPWGGPALALDLAFHGVHPLSGVLAAELGWVGLPARGLVDGDSRLFTLAGEWFTLRAGAAYRF